MLALLLLDLEVAVGVIVENKKEGGELLNIGHGKDKAQLSIFLFSFVIP